MEDWISQPEGSSADRALLAPCSAQLDGLRDVGGVLVLDKALLADASTLQSIFYIYLLKIDIKGDADFDVSNARKPSEEARKNMRFTKEKTEKQKLRL